ncbi:uncharacterized protein BX663DRAFT_557041 [Cokeromyces recurvatus]|uniref:uncharacterized protein n=1 Tax=Cokeromyces recurvatus TaxID=90255 RepID=UPI00221E8E3A|nr:uncharacterized protein BX663DRAFT_557041 [Cokeromyces recurvatus]KAI7907797.1 hypothetical protein BX663DRAFT_557041 [Cokeromyces recurvatus]
MNIIRPELSFWSDAVGEYKGRIGDYATSREIENRNIKSRCVSITAAYTAFSGCVAQVMRRNASGASTGNMSIIFGLSVMFLVPVRTPNWSNRDPRIIYLFPNTISSACCCTDMGNFEDLKTRVTDACSNVPARHTGAFIQHSVNQFPKCRDQLPL